MRSFYLLVCVSLALSAYSPLSNRIVHFHGLSSTWCSVVSPLTESDAFHVSELNSN